MNGWLRSWKLCEVTPQTLHGVDGWKKQRLTRAPLLIPPGNLFLTAIDAGCRVVGADWADHEVAVFKRTHADAADARRIDPKTIWLPHLSGTELRKIPDRRAILSAFEELARFHRLAARSIHGDPHAGNFLYDPQSERCRIIDFETTLPGGMEAAQGRARDFAVLALDLQKLGHACTGDSWREAYGESEEFCPIGRLLHRPGIRLRRYWQWLGYYPRGFAMGPVIDGMVKTGQDGKISPDETRASARD